MKAFISAISIYEPAKAVTNSELAQRFPEWTVEKIAGKIGIDQRYVAAEDEYVSDMAVKAGLKLFEEHHIDPSKIDFILLCTQSPDYFLPATACIVQDKLGVSTKSGAIDFNQGCSGYVYGLALAKGLICGGIAKNILLLTSEAYTKYIHPSDKGNLTIFGDAATATLIGTSGFAEIGEFELGTDGTGAENLIVKNGAVKNPSKTGETTTDEFGNVVSPDHLYMNGSAIFNFTLESVPQLVKSALEANKLSSEDVNHYIFHQANKFMLNHLRKKIGIPEEKFLIYMKDHGNTVSSTIPIVLNYYSRRQHFKKDENILLAGFGVGYSWAGTIIKMVDGI